MKMSPEKREAVIKVAAGFLVGLGLLWWFGVHSLENDLGRLRDQIDEARSAADKATFYVKGGPTVQANLLAARARLETEEAGLVPIDGSNPRNWLLKEINRVIAASGASVDLEQITLMEPADRNVELLPKFPYRANQFRVRMGAYYQDFGKFLSDFENKFPYIRIQDLTIKPSEAAAAVDPSSDAGASGSNAREAQISEKLSFDFVVVALVRTLNTP